MIEAFSQEIVLGLGIALLFILLAAGLITLRNLRRALRESNDTFTRHINQLERTLSDLRNQCEEDQSRVVLLTRHVKDIETALRSLEQQLSDVKLHDPSMRLYQRAAELVKQGASAEELMHACDLPRAEAELLIQVHKAR